LATILRIAPTTGYVALYLWGLFFQPPTIALAKGTGPFALLPAATVAFYGNHLDKVELGRRPWRPWEVDSQTLARWVERFAKPIIFAIAIDGYRFAPPIELEFIASKETEVSRPGT